jgi:hypothetical protein
VFPSSELEDGNTMFLLFSPDDAESICLRNVGIYLPTRPQGVITLKNDIVNEVLHVTLLSNITDCYSNNRET